MTSVFNNTLKKAMIKKDDEYYTQLDDITKELKHWQAFLHNKVVYCNCDDYRVSNFVRYFKENFHVIGIKRLVATSYVEDDLNFFNSLDNMQVPYHYEYDGKKEEIKAISGNGSFNSEYCQSVMRKCDVVVSNPPFSKIESYFDMLVWGGVEYLFVAPLTCVGRKSVSESLRTGNTYVGYNTVQHFNTEDGVRSSPCLWLTSFRRVNPPSLREYCCYDDYNYRVYRNCKLYVIDVDSSRRVPVDYLGYMALPYSFVQFWNWNDYELIGRLKDYGTKHYRSIQMSNKSKHRGDRPYLLYDNLLDRGKEQYRNLDDDEMHVISFGRLLFRKRSR